MTLDQIKGLVGDLARPFAIISTSLSASVAVVVVAFRIASEGVGVAAFVAAIYAGLAGLYGFKSWENRRPRAEAPAVQTPGDD